MQPDSTRRFSSRVEDYIRYRPSYPPGLTVLLQRECALAPGSRIADIGSGTGILAQQFLALGCEVAGVEPNADMRSAGDRLLAHHPRFRSIEGRAESTGLPDAAFDFVTAGQSFHWFDQPAARREFSRILRPGGWIVLVWNERLVTGEFLEGYEALLHRYSRDYAAVDHRRIDAAAMDNFFGAGNWRTESLPNSQEFDLEGVLGRLHSSSYAPPAGSPEFHAINAELTRLFERCHHRGRISYLYETRVWWGH